MWQFNCHCEENRLDKAAWWGSSLCSVFISTTSGISCQCLATEIELEAGTYVRQCGQVQRVRATLPSISDCSSVVLAPVWQCPRQSPQSLSYSPCSSHPEHFYISLRRHLLQFLPSSWLHIELSKIACHHDHVIITSPEMDVNRGEGLDGEHASPGRTLPASSPSSQKFLGLPPPFSISSAIHLK